MSKDPSVLPFSAEVIIGELGYQRYRYWVAIFPEAALGHPRLRQSPVMISGIMVGHEFEGPLLKSREHGRYIVVSSKLVRLAGFVSGTPVETNFRLLD